MDDLLCADTRAQLGATIAFVLILQRYSRGCPALPGPLWSPSVYLEKPATSGHRLLTVASDTKIEREKDTMKTPHGQEVWLATIDSVSNWIIGCLAKNNRIRKSLVNRSTIRDVIVT